MDGEVVDVVVGGIEHLQHSRMVEYAALDDGIDALHHARIAELEGPCDDEGFAHVRLGLPHVDDAAAVHGDGIGIAVDGGGDARIEHSPLAVVDGIDVGVGRFGMEDDEAPVGIVVDDAAVFDEGAEGHEGQVVCAPVVEMEEGADARYLCQCRCAGVAYGVGDTCDRRAAEDDDAACCGEDHGVVGLRDAGGVDADVARDGMYGGVEAVVGGLKGPYAVCGEGIERELAVLSLREGLGGRCQRDDVACAYGVDAAEGEEEGVAGFGGVYFAVFAHHGQPVVS